jgi:iron complex outermembrane receptor protein
VTTAYLEDAFYLTRDFALVGGAQYTTIDRKLDDNFLSNGDETRSADFDFWSPKIAFLWDVSRHAQLFGNISKSYEAATFNEITFVSGDTLALRPQEAVTYEIGVRGAGRGFSYDVALYRANLENEFQCLSNGASGTCTQINLDKSIHQGVEVGAGVEIVRDVVSHADALWLNAAYTFNDFRFDGDATFGDNELPGAPRHFLRAELLYKHASGVYFGPNVEWVPEAYFADSANTLETKAYGLLGAKLGFDNGGPITAYIEGRNLTDEAYISSASIATVADAASTLFEPGNGRAVYGGVQVKW